MARHRRPPRRGVSAVVPTVSGSGASVAAANGSNGSSSSLVHKPTFIGALAAVGVVLALIVFLVLRCRRRRSRTRGRKLDAEMDAAFRLTVSTKKEKASFDVESGAGGELYRAQSALSTASYTSRSTTSSRSRGPYSAAPDHAHATPSRRASAAYAFPGNANADTYAYPSGEMGMADEPAFEMLTPAIAVSSPPHPQAQVQAQGQAYPHGSIYFLFWTDCFVAQNFLTNRLKWLNFALALAPSHYKQLTCKEFLGLLSEPIHQSSRRFFCRWNPIKAGPPPASLWKVPAYPLSTIRSLPHPSNSAKYALCR
ncbi:hypothetical protein K438DRAFT_258094 [Mycena galopus ATCC 62051]|nr:hypothetical protein K438DRAFT_258094 [Mycena galopus ATCC 62051]